MDELRELLKEFAAAGGTFIYITGSHVTITRDTGTITATVNNEKSPGT